MRRLFVVVLALLFVAPDVARSQSTDGTIGIALAEAPTSRADDPRARLYIVDHVAPGTTISRRVTVSNNTSSPQTIDTYAASASVKNGEFRFGEGRARNELTTWTAVEPHAGAYAPGESKQVLVTIAVPKNASEGERYAVVWASVASPQASDGITTVNRVGVRVYLSVGPGGEPASNFSIRSISAARTGDGEPQVRATVANTGGRALDLSGTLRLSEGPGGLSAGPFPVKVGTTLGVGESGPVLVTLDKALPAGPWKAQLELESGLLKRTSTKTITFPAGPGAGDVASDSSPLSATSVAAAGVAVLLAVVLFVVSRRRREQLRP